MKIRWERVFPEARGELKRNRGARSQQRCPFVGRPRLRSEDGDIGIVRPVRVHPAGVKGKLTVGAAVGMRTGPRGAPPWASLMMAILRSLVLD